MGIHNLQTNFTCGEISPLLEGRVDIAKYANALLRMENFLIDPHGPAVFRPGFKYIEETKTSATKSRLIPFVFSATDAVMLEFGAAYIRFYKDQAQVLSGASPYEIVSPYAAADVADIKYCQSADVLYLFHPDYAPRKLSRLGGASWVLSVINFRPPPTSEIGIAPAATLTPAAITGLNIVFTAGASVFLSGDVGRIITSGVARASITAFISGTQVYCDIIDDFLSTAAIASGSWEMLGSPSGTITPSIMAPEGAICTITGSGGSEAFTNLIVPADPDSTDWDASGSGTNEYYINNSATFFLADKPSKIYIDSIEAVEGVLGTLGIIQWAWGDNDTLGYDTLYVRLSGGTDPDAETVASYIKSSVVSATKSLFRTSDVGKYLRVNDGFIKITQYVSTVSVKGEIIKELSEITASSSWTIEEPIWNATNGYPSCGTFYEERLITSGVPAFPENTRSSQTGDYENFTPGVDDSDSLDFSLGGRLVNKIVWLEPREYLILGTVGSEWRLGPEDTGDPLTPLNVVAKQQTTFGCADILPVTVGHTTLFVQRALRKIREFTWDYITDGYVAPDMTLLAEHITESGIVGMAYQQEPLSIVWAHLVDGSLIGMTYIREQEVVGWHKHPIDGEVESIATIPGDGYDELWAIIKRSINGATVRYVELMAKQFTDDAATYTTNKGLNAFFVDCGITYNGAAATTITGLSHLEGEEVAILADGAVRANLTVASGQITLDRSASVVHVGLPYTGLLQTVRPEFQLRDGTAQGRIKRIIDLYVRVHNSSSFKAGRDETHLNNALFKNSDVAMGELPALFTGDKRVGYEGNFDRDARLFIVQDKPLPLTVVAIMAEVSA